MSRTKPNMTKSKSSPARSTGLSSAASMDKLSIMGIAASLYVVFFLFVAPFSKGLFYSYGFPFERPILNAVTWSAVLLLFVAVYYAFFRKTWNGSDWLGLLAWGVPLSYVLSTISAASRHYSVTVTLMFFLCAVLFLLGLIIARNPTGRTGLGYAIVTSGYLLVLYGFLNLFGNVYFEDAIMMGEDGLRMTSVFQYANAYASYLMALLLMCLVLLVTGKKKTSAAVHALLLVPILVSFLLTLSRGGVVMLPFIFLAVLPLLPLARQLLLFLYLAIGAGSAMLLSNTMTETGTKIYQHMVQFRKLDNHVHVVDRQNLLSLGDSVSRNGWFALLAVSLCAGGVLFLIQWLLAPRLEKALEGWNRRKLSHLYLPAGLIVLGLLGVAILFGVSGIGQYLPSSLQRIQKINFQEHSVLERLTMFSDALKIWLDYPVFGTGGGGWISLYTEYQHHAYSPRQVHSFFLQYLVETGLVGLVALFALLGFTFTAYIRRHARKREDSADGLLFYIAALALLVHSVLDFELSYAYLSGLVFLCLGGMASGAEGSFRIPEWKWLQSRRSLSRGIYSGLLGAAAILVLISGIRSLRADSLFNRGFYSPERSYAAVTEPIDQALKLAPGHPDYALNKASYMLSGYNQTKDETYYQGAMKLLDNLKKTEPHQGDIDQLQYSLYASKGQWSQALAVAKGKMERNRWVIDWYGMTASAYVQLGEQAAGKQIEVAQNAYQSALGIYSTLQSRMKELENLPKGELVTAPFYVTPGVALPVGQAYIRTGNGAEAVAVMREGISRGREDFEDPSMQVLTRWYLAALQKQGKTDKDISDKFLAKLPGEKQQIDALASSL